MTYPALKVGEDGFLGAGSASCLLTFNGERKVRFLELLKDVWPDVSRCCRAVGIHQTTYSNHLKSDVKFCEAVKAIKAAKLDELEAVAMESGHDKAKGFLDRAMILRAHRPELYDRAKVVKIEGYKMGQGERAQRMAGLDNVIDGEIVKAYTDRKERRQLKQQKGLGAGQGGGGGDGKA